MNYLVMLQSSAEAISRAQQACWWRAAFQRGSPARRGLSLAKHAHRSAGDWTIVLNSVRHCKSMERVFAARTHGCPYLFNILCT